MNLISIVIFLYIYHFIIRIHLSSICFVLITFNTDLNLTFIIHLNANIICTFNLFKCRCNS